MTFRYQKWEPPRNNYRNRTKNNPSGIPDSAWAMLILILLKVGFVFVFAKFLGVL